MKPLVVTLLLLSTLVPLLEEAGAQPKAVSSPQALPPVHEDVMECAPACDYRCSKASRAKLCLRYCNVCCQRCNCVPPGTSGNKEVCPCYANMMSSKGTHKCP